MDNLAGKLASLSFIICAFTVGYCESSDKDEAPLMILEYMQYGDLKEFLFSHKYAM